MDNESGQDNPKLFKQSLPSYWAKFERDCSAMKIANINAAEASKFEGRDNYFLFTPENGGAKNMLVGYTIVWPGCETKPAHSHQEMEEVYYVTRGRGAIVVDQEEREVAAGDVIYIPFGSTHLAKNKGLAPFEYLWVISPPILPDFLKKKATPKEQGRM